MRAYNLTGADNALSNLAMRRVKIARFADLNDPFELLAVDLREKHQRRAFRDTKEQVNEYRGLICFSKKWSNPLLWGHYAKGHTGVALGFEIPTKLLVPVIYSRKPLRIPINRKSNLPDVSPTLMIKLLRTKFADWQYEQEVRFFVHLDHSKRESGLYFLEFGNYFQLKEVILGPRCTLPISAVRKLVAGLYDDVKVIKARIAFGSFRVIKNLAVR